MAATTVTTTLRRHVVGEPAVAVHHAIHATNEVGIKNTTEVWTTTRVQTRAAGEKCSAENSRAETGSHEFVVFWGGRSCVNPES